jgi:O86/O127-antigen biosynthesis beta-1,3-galactosyltransferase
MCASNAAPFIAEAVESIFAQTFDAFELLVVENGSSDDTWSVLQKFKDPRLRLFQTELKQLPFNLNYGVMHARAPLIARMDADDVAYPTRLAAQVKFMDSHPAVTVLGTSIEVFGDNRPMLQISPPQTDKEIRAAMPFRFVLCHPSVMMRRDKLIQFRGYEHTRYCEDLDLWLRMARDTNTRFANLPQVLLRYRVHQTQSKGSWEAYCSTASILVKEGLVCGRPKLLFAAFMALFKGVVIRNRTLRNLLRQTPFFRTQVF